MIGRYFMSERERIIKLKLENFVFFFIMTSWSGWKLKVIDSTYNQNTHSRSDIWSFCYIRKDESFHDVLLHDRQMERTPASSTTQGEISDWTPQRHCRYYGPSIFIGSYPSNADKDSAIDWKWTSWHHPLHDLERVVPSTSRPRHLVTVHPNISYHQFSSHVFPQLNHYSLNKSHSLIGDVLIPNRLDTASINLICSECWSRWFWIFSSDNLSNISFTMIIEDRCLPSTLSFETLTRMHNWHFYYPFLFQ